VRMAGSTREPPTQERRKVRRWMGVLMVFQIWRASSSRTIQESLRTGPNFSGMQAQKVSYLKLHTVDLGQETGRRGVIVGWITLYLAEMGDLSLELRNPFQCGR